MLDVHPPHHRLGGLKDFFIHLLTISVGLLIAVGIEGCVERHQHRELAQEARETLRKEIGGNSKTMKDALTDIDKRQTAVENAVVLLKRIRQNPKDKSAQKGSFKTDFSLTELDDTAWKTAQTTGALTFMPYDEANKYSGIYETQYQFKAAEEKISEDFAQLLGIIGKYDFDKDITSEAAGATIERFNIMKVHLAALKLMAEGAAAKDEGFLTGKDVSDNFHEDIK
ncbi:hypothetical protein [Granulicella sp. S156]|jgi:hypothetical protein|uniref:hypothetical protein n=1 Tax=Granulicella sp. S156 TaxID=1747224 RepID=UPI00131B5761|nr:hypothetical protein [Granulicella sp. S156]